MTLEIRTEKIEARTWGISVPELAVHPTVYADGLLAGRSFLISGGGSGMGRATAVLAARLGAKVMICGRDGDKLDRAASEIKEHVGTDIETFAMSIRDPDAVDRLMDEAFSRLGTVDALVNSAGGQFPINAIDLSHKGWNAVVDTNLNGTWYMMQPQPGAGAIAVNPAASSTSSRRSTGAFHNRPIRPPRGPASFTCRGPSPWNGRRSTSASIPSHLEPSRPKASTTTRRHCWTGWVKATRCAGWAIHGISPKASST